MIPALVLPLYNRSDLMARMVASIDVPAARTLVVVNGDEGPPPMPPLLGDARVLRAPFASFGYGGSINLGIAQMADAPWWLFASNDVEFLPGALGSVCEAMDGADGRVVTQGWMFGALDQATVRRAGLVDEWGFFPVYFDDNDYERRCRLAGIDWREVTALRAHPVSQTIGSDERASAGNGRTFGDNRDRYLRKWGGPPRREAYETPWDETGMPLWATSAPDPRARAARQW